MTKVRLVQDYFVSMSGALGRFLGGFWKAEGEFLKRRGKRQTVCSQKPPIFQDVDRIYMVALALKRRELRVKGWLREQAFAIFGYLNGRLRQRFDSLIDIFAH